MTVAESPLALAQKPEEQAFPHHQDNRGIFIVLLSITALMCSGLELENLDVA